MNYYTLPDNLPTWNYYKISETKDLRYLIRLDDYSELPEKVDIKKLAELYSNISYAMPAGTYDLSLLREKNLLAILRNKHVAKIHPKFATLSEVQQKKIEKLIELRDANGTDSFNLDDEIIVLEGLLNVSIDPMTCSIKKFISYRKLAKRKDENIKQQNRKNSLKGR